MAKIFTLDEFAAPKQSSGALFARMGQRAERIVFGTAFMVALFVVWEVASAFSVEPSIILPSPADVVRAFGSLFSSADIWQDLSTSGQELLYGSMLAAAVGIVAGLAIGWYPQFGYFVDPFINFLYAIDVSSMIDQSFVKNARNGLKP